VYIFDHIRLDTGALDCGPDDLCGHVIGAGRTQAAT
jgi:hypothetical protein